VRQCSSIAAKNECITSILRVSATAPSRYCWAWSARRERADDAQQYRRVLANEVVGGRSTYSFRATPKELLRNKAVVVVVTQLHIQYAYIPTCIADGFKDADINARSVLTLLTTLDATRCVLHIRVQHVHVHQHYNRLYRGGALHQRKPRGRSIGSLQLATAAFASLMPLRCSTSI
jgi:hypothetical protein